MIKVTWLGHSAVKIEGSKTIYIDPFIMGNPACSCTLDDIKKADMVFVTHYHDDHVGDAFFICQKTGATLIAIHEIAVEATELGITAEGMNIGGTVTVENVKFNMVSALHSAKKGTPAGIVIEIDGSCIYHAGDTGLTYDMKLVGEFFKPDLSLLPIGDRFTMGIASAAKAVEYTQTRRVVPIHYNTFEPVNADPQAFKDKVGSLAEVIILKPGESYELKTDKAVSSN
ncbi:MAG: metal-dependent hydrolase [Candidatus Riflebacteria bacterium]|nr:metal-dependent hydrolase [Candidatus Riflebacteria bacterium]